MDKEIGKWLVDIMNSILEIESFFEGKALIFDEYKTDIKTKRAVERDLEIIGEAVNRIIKKDASIIINNARQIVQFRNFVIHSYDNISDQIVWAVIINHLPNLKNEIIELIKKNFPNLHAFVENY